MSKDPKEFARKLCKLLDEFDVDLVATSQGYCVPWDSLPAIPRVAIVATPEGLSAIKPSIESTQKYLGGIPVFMCQTLDLAKIQQAQLLDDGYSLVYVIDRSIEWDEDWQPEMNDELRRLRDDAIKEHAEGLTVHLFPEDDE